MIEAGKNYVTISRRTELSLSSQPMCLRLSSSLIHKTLAAKALSPRSVESVSSSRDGQSGWKKRKVVKRGRIGSERTRFSSANTCIAWKNGQKIIGLGGWLSIIYIYLKESLGRTTSYAMFYKGLCLCRVGQSFSIALVSGMRNSNRFSLMHQS